MDRQEIIKKAMVKLGMMGDPSDPVDDTFKQKLLKSFWNEKDPDKIYKITNGLIRRDDLSKEAVQDLMKFFKLKGLFKRLLNFNVRGMEQMWRTILKEQKLQGFSLEN